MCKAPDRDSDRTATVAELVLRHAFVARAAHSSEYGQMQHRLTTEDKATLRRWSLGRWNLVNKVSECTLEGCPLVLVQDPLVSQEAGCPTSPESWTLSLGCLSSQT